MKTSLATRVWKLLEGPKEVHMPLHMCGRLDKLGESP